MNFILFQNNAFDNISDSILIPLGTVVITVGWWLRCVDILGFVTRLNIDFILSIFQVEFNVQIFHYFLFCLYGIL